MLKLVPLASHTQQKQIFEIVLRVAQQGRDEGSVNDSIPDRGEVGRRTT